MLFCCLLCRSSWPAYTTLEAYNNYRRGHKMHPGLTCHELAEGK